MQENSKSESVNNEYNTLLKTYTKIYENSRYDRISSIGSLVTIVENELDLITDKYRSYGTYRHDITSDDINVKINETYNDENDIVEYFYRGGYSLKSEDTQEKNVEIDYKFPGSVIAKLFACNGREVTLEDLFAEYGYDYLKAYDKYLKNQGKEKKFWYFDESTDDNQDTYVDGSYTILPIGQSFINYDFDTGIENEYREELIEYDGTYVPTVDDILSGRLYIVIKSGDLNPRKIYFNNTYLPTLFVNADKYKDKSNQYIINELQTIKLCDITLNGKLGCKIKWNMPATITGISDIGSQLNSYGIKGPVSLRSYYYVAYETYGTKKIILLSGGLNKTALELASDIKQYNSASDLENIDFFEHFNNFITSPIFLSLSDMKEKIEFEIYLGLSIILHNYKTQEPIIPEPEIPEIPESNEYSLYWYEIVSN